MAVVNENDIKTAVKNNNYSRAYYFYGKDTVAVEKYTKALSARLVSKDDATYNLHQFDGKNLDIELLSDSCEALPMFAEYVCCVVSDLNAETLNADQLNTVIEIVKNLPDTTVLIFYYTSVDVTDGKKNPTPKNKKLLDAVSKNGSVCNFALKTSDTLAKEIMAAVSKAGCGISRDAARFLAEQCSCNTMIISNEIAKLTAYAQGNEITMDIIRQLSPRQIETTTFDLAKAIMRMDRKTAMRLFNDLVEEKIEPIKIIYAVSGNLLDMYRARTAMAVRKSPADVKADFGYAKNVEFRVDNAFRDVQKISMPHLRMCINTLAETDALMKSSKTSPQILLEEALVKMLTFKR